MVILVLKTVVQFVRIDALSTLLEKKHMLYLLASRGRTALVHLGTIDVERSVQQLLARLVDLLLQEIFLELFGFVASAGQCDRYLVGYRICSDSWNFGTTDWL